MVNCLESGIKNAALGAKQVEPAAHEVTELLTAWSRGDEAALEKLTPLVYDELHRTAHRYMTRELAGHTLQTTALINEVFLRLVDARGIGWQDRAHFLAICARLMRRVLTDFARSKAYFRRGGDSPHVGLDGVLLVSRDPPTDLLALDDSLNALAVIDPRKSRVVELRFFGGLSVEETAEVLKVSPDTVKRDWKLAKVWLVREMGGKRPDER